MLVIILLGITLKYSILCTFSWFLVKLLLLIKTAQLTVRGSLNGPPPRFSLQEPPRARFILESHHVTVDEGFPGLLPYLYLLEIDQALTGATLLSCQATSSNLRDRLWKGRGRKEKVEGIRERGKGTSSPFLFRAFLPLPSPPLHSPVLRLSRNLTSSKNRNVWNLTGKKTNKLWEIFNFHLEYLWDKLSDGANTSRCSTE